MTLDTAVIDVIDTCESEQCMALLIGAVAVGGASLVVSGSIYIIANVIYWIEREANC